MNRPKTCSTCKHLVVIKGPNWVNNNCMIVDTALSFEIHGTDSFAKVKEISIDNPDVFGCTLHEIKDMSGSK